MPKDDEQLAKTSYWTVIFLTPIVTCTISTIMLFFYHRYDSLAFSIYKDEIESPKMLLKAMYKKENEAVRD